MPRGATHRFPLSLAAAESYKRCMIQSPLGVFTVLVTLLALLFGFERTRWGRRFFAVVPLIVFAYFTPTLLSNTGVIPLESGVYDFIRAWLLPASLMLLTLSVDVPAVLGLGRNALVMFFTATVSILIGGPIAYLAVGHMLPPELGDQAWRGLAALCGSWIGGGANFLAVGKSVGASDSTLSMMAVVDVAVANIWMAVLLWFAGREAKLDAAIGADRTSIDRVRDKVQEFQRLVSRSATLPDLLAILAVAFGATWIATALAAKLPDIGTVINGFTWVVVLVTTFGLLASFTPLRRLEGAGASRIGSVFLYLLVTTIGAKAEFARVKDAPWLLVIGLVWITIHAAAMLSMRRLLRAPIFFLAVGSQANIGGAASAPVVASAFHPALAPVGVLLAILGYVLGTYAAILCGAILQRIHIAMF